MSRLHGTFYSRAGVDVHTRVYRRMCCILDIIIESLLHSHTSNLLSVYQLVSEVVSNHFGRLSEFNNFCVHLSIATCVQY